MPERGNRARPAPEPSKLRISRDVALRVEGGVVILQFDEREPWDELLPLAMDSTIVNFHKMLHELAGDVSPVAIRLAYAEQEYHRALRQMVRGTVHFRCGSNQYGFSAATNKWLYVSRTFTERAEVWRIAVDAPEQRELVADLGPGLALLLDDLAVTQRYVFVAANLAGSIFRIDVASGASCKIASGLTLPSAVKFGTRAAASAPDKLYATSLAGDLYELTDE